MQVRAQLKEHSILLYDVGEGEDQPPYAVVSSNTLTRLEDGRRVRGREYPWGTVNIEDKVCACYSILLSSDHRPHIF